MFILLAVYATPAGARASIDRLRRLLPSTGRELGSRTSGDQAEVAEPIREFLERDSLAVDRVRSGKAHLSC